MSSKKNVKFLTMSSVPVVSHINHWNSKLMKNRQTQRTHCLILTSAMLISASVYCRPFWMIDRRAAGGTKAPFMLDWLIWLSMPNVYAECTNPKEWTKMKSTIFSWYIINSGISKCWRNYSVIKRFISSVSMLPLIWLA